MAEWVRFTLQTLRESVCYACVSEHSQVKHYPFPSNEMHTRVLHAGGSCVLVLSQNKGTRSSETCWSPLLLSLTMQTGPPELPPFSFLTSFLTSHVTEGWIFFLTHLGIGSLSTHVQNVSIDKETNSNYSWFSVPDGNLYSGTLPNWCRSCTVV